MAKFITQATFDEVVKENIEDFGMDKEAAAADAIAQFKSQGTYPPVMLAFLALTPLGYSYQLLCCARTNPEACRKVVPFDPAFWSKALELFHSSCQVWFS